MRLPYICELPRRGRVCDVDDDCDDGFLCDGVEVCADGACVAGDAFCSVETCLEDLGAPPTCVECQGFADCYDGDFCDGDARCVAGRCIEGPVEACGVTSCTSDDDCGVVAFCEDDDAGGVCVVEDWCEGEPNNGVGSGSTAGQACLQMFPNSQSGPCWDDEFCGDDHRFACTVEVDTSVDVGGIFIGLGAVSFAEASAACVAAGGDLVVDDDVDPEVALEDAVIAFGALWIGGKRPDPFSAGFVWVDGTSVPTPR